MHTISFNHHKGVKFHSSRIKNEIKGCLIDSDIVLQKDANDQLIGGFKPCNR